MSREDFIPKPGDLYLYPGSTKTVAVEKVYKTGNVILAGSDKQHRPIGGLPDQWDRLEPVGSRDRWTRIVIVKATPERVAERAAKAEHDQAKLECGDVFDAFGVTLHWYLDKFTTEEVKALTEAVRPFAEKMRERVK